MPTIDVLRGILKETLQLGKRADKLDENTALFGVIPEFDSFAVVAVVNSIEERFGVVVEDDEITAETFATVGSLVQYLDEKIASA